jgi:hypothetical protein
MAISPSPRNSRRPGTPARSRPTTSSLPGTRLTSSRAPLAGNSAHYRIETGRRAPREALLPGWGDYTLLFGDQDTEKGPSGPTGRVPSSAFAASIRVRVGRTHDRSAWGGTLGFISSEPCARSDIGNYPFLPMIGHLNEQARFVDLRQWHDGLDRIVLVPPDNRHSRRRR